MTQIIILSTPVTQVGRLVNYLFWHYPTVGNQQYYKKPNVVSQFLRATPADNIELTNGVKVETSGSFAVPAGFTRADIQAVLQERWNAVDAAFTREQAAYNNYGQVWDGSGWSVL